MQHCAISVKKWHVNVHYASTYSVLGNSKGRLRISLPLHSNNIVQFSSNANPINHIRNALTKLAANSRTAIAFRNNDIFHENALLFHQLVFHQNKAIALIKNTPTIRSLGILTFNAPHHQFLYLILSTLNALWLYCSCLDT